MYDNHKNISEPRIFGGLRDLIVAVYFDENRLNLKGSTLGLRNFPKGGGGREMRADQIKGISGRFQWIG